MDSEFPIDYPVTNTRMSCLSLACSLPEKYPQKKPYNEKLIHTILAFSPDINKRDKFNRTPLHLAARVGNETAITILIKLGMPT